MGLFAKDRNLALPPERVELPVRASDFRRRTEEMVLRLDAFLSHHLHWRSRNSLQALIRDGYVRVTPGGPDATGGTGRSVPADQAPVERRPSRKLRDGCLVVIDIPIELRLPPTLADPAELVVLWEDKDLLAVDKPPLLPVHPSGRHVADTLIQRVHLRYAEELRHTHADDEALGRIPVRLCHRLDRETSGIVLIGKSREGHRALMRQFERREIDKEYLAVVHGEPERSDGVIDMPLGPSRTSAVHLRMAIDPKGQASRTTWRVVRRVNGQALVACQPYTGRQHQIRVHLAAIGHPLVGDKLYGDDEGFFLRDAAGVLTVEDRRRLQLTRHALHNHRLAFTHPRSGERIELESPLAEDLRQHLEERAAGFRHSVSPR